MLGLLESRRSDLVKDMLDNFAYLIATVGHIPNGNRTYYLGRSQPPFFAAMVGLYAKATDTTQALRYLSAMEAEHAFWMDGADRVTPGQAYRRVVMMPEGVALNRTGTIFPDHGRSPTVPTFKLQRRYRTVCANGSTATLARRQRAGGISRAAGCAIHPISNRWRPPN
jgi:neutral trehalase